jgi:hypothetical protein
VASASTSKHLPHSHHNSLTAEEASAPRKISLGNALRSAGDSSRQVGEDHQGRFRKLQAARLPRLVSLALFVSGEMWLAQIHFPEIESLPQAVGGFDDSRSRFLDVESLTVLQTSCVGLILALVAV